MDVERVAERFWAKVQKTDSCWLWTAALTGHGYGVFWNGERLEGAHRWAYRMLVGEIPAGADLDHLCRNRPCVNPDHLDPVTHRENVLRGVGVAALNAKKAACPRGHGYTPENTSVLSNGRRVCKTCKRERDEQRRRRRGQPQRASRIDVGEGHRVCSRCHEVKEFPTAFYRYKDGYRAMCKPCFKERW